MPTSYGLHQAYLIRYSKWVIDHHHRWLSWWFVRVKWIPTRAVYVSLALKNVHFRASTRTRNRKRVYVTVSARRSLDRAGPFSISLDRVIDLLCADRCSALYIGQGPHFRWKVSQQREEFRASIPLNHIREADGLVVGLLCIKQVIVWSPNVRRSITKNFNWPQTDSG